MSLGRQGTTTINLDYQDGCHYEPLMKVKTKMMAAVKTSNLNLDHNKCKAKDISHEKDDDEKMQQEDIKIFRGNLSSWQIHCQEAL